MMNETLAQAAIEKGVSTLVVLEGQAPEQHNNQPVIISGRIDAVSRFIEGRGAEFKDAKKHCIVSKANGIIEMKLNEQSVTDKYIIQGVVQVAKKFKALGINDDKRSYAPEELANKFKLMRSFFVNPLEHATLCSTLRNLKAKINRELNEQDDRRGNVTRDFKQTVQSNVPEEFTIKMPLLEGEDATEFKVSVILEAEGVSSIRCFLESVDAADSIEQQFEQRIDLEIAKIANYVTVIEC